jgi:thiol-disulfide isomerase/thioredoxin
VERGQLIAALVVAVVIGALVAVQVGRNQDTEVDLGAVAGETPVPSTPSTITSGSAAVEPTDAPVDAPENLGAAGTLRELEGWLQTDATSFEDFDGQVRVVQFWTFGCYNCRNTIPALQGIYERWQPEGLEIIGVHAPEFDREKDVDAIAAAAVEHGVVWPIALDTEKTNFRDWQPGRRFWPRTFVVDQNGDVRFDHIGEGHYDELEATVAYLVVNGP